MKGISGFLESDFLVSHNKVCPRNGADTDESNLPEKLSCMMQHKPMMGTLLLQAVRGGGPPGGVERELNSTLCSMESENSTIAITTPVSPSSPYAASRYSADTTGYLSVLYFNARSIFPKHDEQRALIEIHTPELICIVETWLCDI